jgi:putative nucleotidyltransferase with HDIG domain
MPRNQTDRTLVVLNRISEMVAGRNPLSEILYAVAEATQDLTHARWGLFLYRPPARPVEFYGSDEAMRLGPALLEALETAGPANGHLTTLTMVPPDGASGPLATVTASVFHGRALRGALAAVYDAQPARLPVTTLTLLNNQARIAMEKWRMGNIDPESYDGVIQALASLIDTRDPYAMRHSQAVTELAVTLATAVGLDEEEVTDIRYGALLHDIGKIGISEAILSKPGRLLPGERAVVEAHPLVGASILRNIPYMENVIPLIRHHHEHYDGTGYPDRLSGDDIPLGAQIIAVADVFEALTTGERSYHRGLNILEACTILRQEAGKSLHPELVAVFLQTIGLQPEDMPAAV